MTELQLLFKSIVTLSKLYQIKENTPLTVEMMEHDDMISSKINKDVIRMNELVQYAEKMNITIDPLYKRVVKNFKL